ncbi:MAG: DUF1638 domain-containing protein [Acidimicrobiia bacterium]|nr:DUF1638 domain-containing protein [Acidimicrobiia bacterium]
MTDHQPPAPPEVLVLACGALARELRDIITANSFDHVTIECLPGDLHNRPDEIPGAVERRLDAVADRYRTVLLGYADCGTGGRLDELCRRRGIQRLPGPHCYELYAGHEAFAALHHEEPGTFYLTDYLAKHFDRFVWRVLGLDRHPELRDQYFGNYRRLVHLAQVDDPEIRAAAAAAADRLGLAFEHRITGYGGLGDVLVDLGASTR